MPCRETDSGDLLLDAICEEISKAVFISFPELIRLDSFSVALVGPLIQAKQLTQPSVEIGFAEPSARSSSNHQQVQVSLELGPPMSEPFSYPSLETVSRHRITHFSTCCDP